MIPENEYRNVITSLHIGDTIVVTKLYTADDKASIGDIYEVAGFWNYLGGIVTTTGISLCSGQYELYERDGGR